jgi:hypothetical protein
MKRYRLVTHPMRVPKGPWRDSRATAVADALAMGFAHRDDLDPSALRWDPACEIEEMKVDEAILLP